MPNRMRIACLVVLLLILVEGISARQAPTASLRWLLTIDKAPATETPGHHVMLGSQREFRIRLAVSNFEGPRVFGVSSLVQTVSVTVKRDGEMQSVDVDAAFGPRTIPVFLSEGEDLAATLTVRRTDSSPWTAGQYAVTVNMAEFLKGLTTESGGPWAGRAKGEETRVLEVQFPRTQDDWSRYYEVEGNSLLGAGKPADATGYR